MLAVMFVLIGAFLVAVLMMFVHPGVALLLLWLGLIVLCLATGVHWAFKRAEEITLRHETVAYACPVCGAAVSRDTGEARCQCHACGAMSRVGVDGVAEEVHIA